MLAVDPITWSPCSSLVDAFGRPGFLVNTRLSTFALQTGGLPHAHVYKQFQYNVYIRMLEHVRTWYSIMFCQYNIYIIALDKSITCGFAVLGQEQWKIMCFCVTLVPTSHVSGFVIQYSAYVQLLIRSFGNRMQCLAEQASYIPNYPDLTNLCRLNRPGSHTVKQVLSWVFKSKPDDVPVFHTRVYMQQNLNMCYPTSWMIDSARSNLFSF